MLDWPISIAVSIVGGWLIQIAAGLVMMAAQEPHTKPLYVHEVQVATEEQIASAALEVPELMRRAEAAAHRAAP